MYKNTNNFVQLLLLVDKESPNNTRAHVMCTEKTKSDYNFNGIIIRLYTMHRGTYL